MKILIHAAKVGQTSAKILALENGKNFKNENSVVGCADARHYRCSSVGEPTATGDEKIHLMAEGLAWESMAMLQAATTTTDRSET